MHNFPLFSSKYLKFLVWEQIHNMVLEGSYRNKQGPELLQSLKGSMNAKRTEFSWDHLNQIYPVNNKQVVYE
jgi:hypothetical protein